MNREFGAERPNEKWVTDVTEFKYGVGTETAGKIYLSAIIDLCDKRPVSYIISDHNDNPLVFDTFDYAIKEKSGCTSAVPFRQRLSIYKQRFSPENSEGRYETKYVTSCKVY